MKKNKKMDKSIKRPFDNMATGWDNFGAKLWGIKIKERRRH